MSGMSSFSHNAGKIQNVGDLFQKSHISGFSGIKKKYQTNKDAVHPESYQTNFYRTQNMGITNRSDNFNASNSPGFMSLRSNTGRNNTGGTIRNSAGRVPVRGYMTNDINIKGLLK